MPKNLKLTIIKEPNDTNNTNFRKEFPYLGNIYLELLENHKKIKKECIFSGALNKEPILKLEDYKKVRTQQLRNDNNQNDTQQNNKLFHVDENVQYKTNTTKEYETENVVLDKYDKNINEKSEDLEETDYEEDDEFVDNDFEDSQEEEIHIMNKEVVKPGADEVNDRLNEMLKRSNNDESNVSGELDSTVRHENLKKIEAPKVEDINELKREILFKFKLLKKSYPSARIPSFTMEDSYKKMEGVYNDTVHMLTIDSNVETYKSYLLGGFMLTEFLFGKFLKFDMTGFAQQQILQMNQYNKLLIELGEKTYVPKNNWPVEARIFLLIAMNAGMFIVSRMIMKNTGSDLLNMMNSMNIANSDAQKTTMRSPDIDDL